VHEHILAVGVSQIAVILVERLEIFDPHLGRNKQAEARSPIVHKTHCIHVGLNDVLQMAHIIVVDHVEQRENFFDAPGQIHIDILGAAHKLQPLEWARQP
jgi:hypothetical protein